MSIKSITTEFAGQIGVNPRLVRLVSDDSYNTVIAENYLAPLVRGGYVFYPTDFFYIAYGSNSEELGIFTADIASDSITLVPFYGAGSLVPSDPTLTTIAMVNKPVLQNHMAIFTATNGTIGDDAATAINAGDVQAGLTTGTAGSLISCPGTTTTGTLNLTAVASAGAYTTTISNRSMGQSTTFSVGDPSQATASILTSKVVADPGANLISFDVTVTAAALPSSFVTLYQSSGAQRYKIRSLQINLQGTNFSGGGGDRNLAIADNTSVYSLIPAATLQSLANETWGSTALPFPASISINGSTAAGQSLIARYSGGTTDYLAGSIVISGILERVA